MLFGYFLLLVSKKSRAELGERKMKFFVPLRLMAVLGSIYLSFWSLPVNGADIHDAAREGDIAKLKALVTSGVSIHTAAKGGETPLYLAAMEGQSQAVAYLLTANAHPNAVLEGPGRSLGTALHAAVMSGDLETVKVLLDTGAEVNVDDSDLGPPLHLARTWDEPEIVALLLDNGAISIRARSVSSMIKFADLERGKYLATTCNGCHKFNLHSPQDFATGWSTTFWEIVGRAKASVDGFKYSSALKNLGGKWTYDDLNSFLKSPKGFAPGTKMPKVKSMEPENDRAAILAFLRTLGREPYPLPP